VSTTVVDSAAQQNIQSRLDQIMRKFTSVADLARIIGVSDNAIYKWLSGRGQPSVANLVALAKAAKVSVEWLATGQEVAVAKRLSAAVSEHSEFAFLAHYDTAEPGARGETLRSKQVVDHLAFKKEWVRTRLDADPRNLLLIETVGDSMTPTLEDADLLLVDLSEPRFRHDGIYVLRRDDELEVKRLQRRPDGHLNIISDNSAYGPSVVDADSVQVIGRVIWAAGRL
jgi:phage repressor protein C with HTH and peptisase S24 domain